MRTLITCLFFVVLVALPVLAAEVVHILPGAAETPGAAGSYWTSTVWAMNGGSDVAIVTIGLIPYPGITPPTSVTRTIQPGETLTLNAPLAAWDGMKAGTLVLTSASPLVTFLTTQNTADTPKVYGQQLQDVLPADVILAGQKAYVPWVNQSLDVNVGSRTNVGMALLDPNSNVTVRIFDATGNLKGSTNQISGATPLSWQTTVASLIGAIDLPIGYVEFEVVSGRMTGYTSVADNFTSDGLAVQSARLPTGATDVWIAGVARTPGANNSYWTTDVRIWNTSDAATTTTVTAYIGGGAHVHDWSMAPHEVIEIADILGPNGFNLGEGIAGALEITAPVPLMAFGKSSNSDPSGTIPGAFSGLLRAIPNAQFIQTGKSGYLPGIDQATGATGFRTNIAVLGGVNGGAGTLILRDSLGTEMARSDFSLNNGQWTQKNVSQWFPSRSIPDNARVDVNVTAGSVTGYASRTDNASGDATCVPLLGLQTCAAPDATITMANRSCAGENQQASVPFAEGTTYLWTVNGATNVTGTTTNVVSYKVGSGPTVNVTVVVTLGEDCSSTNSDVLAVDQPPSISNFYASPSSINIGESSTLNLSCSNCNSAMVNPGSISVPLTGGSGSVVVSPTSTTTYTATVYGVCSPNATAQTTVTVGCTPPTATVSGSATICSGDSTMIQAALTGTGPWTVIWSDGNTQSGVASSPATRSVSPASTTTYTVTSVTDQYCSGTGSGSAVVTVNNKPVISSLGVSPGTIALGETATISFSISGSTSWSFTLSLNNGIIPGSGTTNGSLTSMYSATANTGTDTITLTVTNSCGSTQDTTSIVVTF